MRKLISILFLALGGVLLFTTDSAASLMAWGRPDVDGDNLVKLLAWSTAGWLLTCALLARFNDGDGINLAVHPAAILLTAAGLGMALFGLMTMMCTLKTACDHRDPKIVAPMGVALALGALMVPRFELLFLALASPLFLIAPRRMQEQSMVIFYAIALAPAVLVLALKAQWDLLSSVPRSAFAAAPLQAGVPMIMLPLLLVPSGDGKAVGKISLIVAAAAYTVLLSQQTVTLWALAICGLGTAVVVHGQGREVREALAAICFTVAVFIHAGQVTLW
ncbi:MAG: hypothetical protein AAGG79_01560 [Pseudomonadota bacterium]